MGSGYSKKKKQMRELQEQFSRMQEELSTIVAEGEAGNGLVTISINGDNDLVNIKLKPECVDPDDIEGLEDLIKIAYKSAQEKLKEKMPDPTGGMGGLAGLGF